jgi:hypothetical protein
MVSRVKSRSASAALLVILALALTLPVNSLRPRLLIGYLCGQIENIRLICDELPSRHLSI